MEFDLENPLTDFDDSTSDAFSSLFLMESYHMPAANYSTTLKARDLDVSVRREAISLISQFYCDSDPFLSYLAVNYVDRFLSSEGIPEQKKWAIRLLAISCVSLAAKMKKPEISITDFQGHGDGDLIFDAQTVERMEYLILGSLKWRMRSITPFSFLSFFISFFELKNPPLVQVLKTRAIQIILKAQSDIELLPFKPSIVAASALLSACHELFPLQFPCFMQAISICPYVIKENMSRCYTAMENVVKEEYELVFEAVSGSNTPVNVLDQQFSSTEFDETDVATTTVTTASASHTAERDMKRRKTNDYDYRSNNNSNQSIQLSQSGLC